MGSSTHISAQLLREYVESSYEAHVARVGELLTQNQERLFEGSVPRPYTVVATFPTYALVLDDVHALRHVSFSNQGGVLRLEAVVPLSADVSPRSVVEQARALCVGTAPGVYSKLAPLCLNERLSTIANASLQALRARAESVYGKVQGAGVVPAPFRAGVAHLRVALGDASLAGLAGQSLAEAHDRLAEAVALYEAALTHHTRGQR